MKKIIIALFAISAFTLAGAGINQTPSPQRAAGDSMAGRQMQPSAAHGETGQTAKRAEGRSPQPTPTPV